KYYHPSFAMNRDDPIFFSENANHGPDETVNPYDPASGIWDEGESIVNTQSFKQWTGDLIADASKGVPSQLSSIADAYMHHVPGIKYELNLKGADMFSDGQVIIVGSSP